MDINQNCKLLLRDIYSYDITACHYNILDKLGVNISHLDKDNKEKRNIQIGLMMRNNPKLIPILRETTNSIISEYLLRNNILEDDIIIRQYDGFLTSKKLKQTTDLYLPLDLRKVFQIFLISIDRDKYIGLDEKFSITIKGIPHRYEKIDKIYEEVLKMNFMNKPSIFKKLDELKHKILFNDDSSLYGIPTSNNLFTVFFRQYGQIDITESMLRIMGTEDIDKEKYYDLYLRPFFESIIVEFV